MHCMLQTYECTTIINNRLMNWSEDNYVLTDAQFEFKQGQSIIVKLLSNCKELYCCFVD